VRDDVEVLIPDYTPKQESRISNREDSAALGGDGLAFDKAKERAFDGEGLTADAPHNARAKRVTWGGWVADI